MHSVTMDHPNDIQNREKNQVRACMLTTLPTAYDSVAPMIDWSIGGVILTGEKRSTGRKTCPSAILLAQQILHGQGLGSNPVLRN
jgi:hypothetical protein